MLGLGRRKKKEFGLFEKLLVHLLDVQGFLNPAPDAVTDHQASKLVAVDEHYSFAQLVGCLTCRR
jgi:hypothetical protein